MSLEEEVSILLLAGVDRLAMAAGLEMSKEERRAVAKRTVSRPSILTSLVDIFDESPLNWLNSENMEALEVTEDERPDSRTIAHIAPSNHWCLLNTWWLTRAEEERRRHLTVGAKRLITSTEPWLFYT